MSRRAWLSAALAAVIVWGVIVAVSWLAGVMFGNS